MEPTIKFTTEELNAVAQIQKEYQNKIMQFGQLELEKILLTQRKAQLESHEVSIRLEFTQLQEKEKQQVDILQAKYGPGKLNPQTGEFEPDTKVSQ